MPTGEAWLCGLLHVKEGPDTMTAPPNLTVPIRESALARWLSTDLALIEIGERRPLAGGVVSPLVERVEVTAVRTTGGRDRFEVVAKRASSAEMIALHEIATVPAPTPSRS